MALSFTRFLYSHVGLETKGVQAIGEGHVPDSKGGSKPGPLGPAAGQLGGS